MIEPIISPDSPAPAGAYSQAIRAGDFVYISGQVPRASGGTYAPLDIERETRLTLQNLAAVATAAGGTLRDVVKVGAYLASWDHLTGFNTAFDEYFDGCPPARTTVVAGLREVKVELDAVLYIPR